MQKGVSGCIGRSKSHVDIAAMQNISVNMVERHVMRALVDISAARDFIM